jgi:uncharacterized protein with von Willebrand factor type A (vWA) domain
MQQNTLCARSSTLLAPQLDYILVDGSSSMQDKWWNTLAALDNFTSVLRSANIASHGIVSVFSGRDLQMIQRDDVIAKWHTFAAAPLASTWHDTPLYDAVNLMGRHLRDLAPSRCSIVIVTDGEENASQTSATQAKSILDWCRAQGWTVTFLGADFDNTTQARLLGANASNSLGVRRELLREAGTLLGKKRIAWHGDGEITFSDGERAKFGGYLGHAQ